MKEHALNTSLDSLEASQDGAGHLKPRLSKLTMVGMSFAILKYVTAMFFPPSYHYFPQKISFVHTRG
jgi:hypothetical protein